MSLRAAVFASGRGSNFQVLAEYVSSSRAPVRGGITGRPPAIWEVSLLVTDREGAPVLDRADALGIERIVVPVSKSLEEVGRHMLDALQGARIDMVLLAGYLRLVPKTVVRRFRGRMLNIHPALLPSFGGKGMYGLRVHEAVLEAGVRLTGVTVHFVDEEYDRGRILAQWPVPVLPGDSPEAIATRIHEVEHRLYPAAADRLARAIAEGVEASAIPGAGARFDLEAHLFDKTEIPLERES